MRRLYSIFLLAGIAFTASNAAEVPPSEWYKEDVLSMSLSQNGTYLAMLRNDLENDDFPVIQVLDLGSSELIHRQRSAPMRIEGFNWISDSKMLIYLSQQVRKRVEGFNRGVYENQILLVDVAKKSQLALGGTRANSRNPSLAHVLPDEPNKVLLSMAPNDLGSKKYPQRAGRPRAYYEVDLESGRKSLVARDTLSHYAVSFDENARPFLSISDDPGRKEIIYNYRPEGTKKWVEFHRVSFDSHEAFNVVTKDFDLPGNVLVLAHNGEDNVSLWSFNLAEGRFEEKIAARPGVDLSGVRFETARWGKNYRAVGVTSFKGSYRSDFWDAEEKAIYDQLRKLLPNADAIAWSRRPNGTVLISNSGPQEPPTYYLLHQGKLTVAGSRYPAIQSKDLGERKFITYKARDGRMIPGLVTYPTTGEAPYSLVVMPHGGPYVSERPAFDPWAALLANHGYMVLQPQYRGSGNYGLEHYLSAFRPKGEAGYKMQDDKDDGALYLVDQGLVHPDRIAMFGWSYGGYAALVAAMRNEQIYQCAIAAAAVSDPLMQLNWYRYQMIGAQEEEQKTTWLQAYSPVKHVADINVPLFLIHGKLDQRVPVSHFNKVLREMQGHEIDFETLLIEDIDHFSSTLRERHKVEIWDNIFRYLAEDCGPDGL